MISARYTRQGRYASLRESLRSPLTGSALRADLGRSIDRMRGRESKRDPTDATKENTMSNTHQYIVRSVWTNLDNGEIEHVFYAGPYPTVSSADRVADDLTDTYRARPPKVDGRECHAEQYINPITFIPPR